MTTVLYEHRLLGVHPLLVKAVRETADILYKTTGRKLLVIEGVRTKEQQEARYAQGRTKPGAIVTRTRFSKHLKQKDGYGHAVDIALCNLKGGIDWTDMASFDTVRRTMMSVAKGSVRSGADWDNNNVVDAKEIGRYVKMYGHRPLVDYPHFEML